MNSITTPMVAQPPSTPAWLESAIFFQSIGLPVFTVEGDKTPLKRWSVEATLSAEVIEQWSRDPRATAFGIKLTEDFMVLDFDPRNYIKDATGQKRDILKEMYSQGLLAETFWVSTPRGGDHFFYRKPKDIDFDKTQEERPGLDVLSFGHMVVGAGSETINSKQSGAGVYKIKLHAAIADAPAALLAVLKRKESVEGIDEGEALSEEDKALVLSALPHVPADDYQIWLNVGMALRAAGFELSVWDVWSRKSSKYKEGVCAGKWESFRSSGITHKTIISYACQNGFIFPGETAQTVFAPFAPNEPPAPDAVSAEQGAKGSQAKEVKAAQFAKMFKALPIVEYWKNQNKRGFVTLLQDRRQEHFEVEGSDFRQVVQKCLFDVHGSVPSKNMLDDFVNLVSTKARYGGQSHQTEVRVAIRDGVIYIDVGDAERSIIKVTPDGWEIVHSAPVKFIRPSTMKALTLPVKAGPEALLKLRQLLNWEDNSAWALLLAFTVACFRPGVPFTVLFLTAQQDSGKTITTEIVSGLTDPSEGALVSLPDSEDGMAVTVAQRHLQTYNNISVIKNWQSDFICMCSHGLAYMKRKLFADSAIVCLNYHKPFLINGIGDLASRPDLLDRSIILRLPSISDEKRKAESQIKAEFESIRAEVLGALLNAVSGALRRLPETKLERKPRMTDFALWATAAEPDLGLQPGEFMAAYLANRGEATEIALDASPFSYFISLLPPVWEGTASELLFLQRKIMTNDRALPVTPRTVSAQLMRLAPALRSQGVSVTWNRTNEKRLIRIERIASVDPYDKLK